MSDHVPLSKLNGDSNSENEKYEKGQPVRLYVLGQAIKVPRHVCNTGIAKIVGYEWGPNNRKRKCTGWLYYLKFDGVQEHYPARESEITEWQLFDKSVSKVK